MGNVCFFDLFCGSSSILLLLLLYAAQHGYNAIAISAYKKGPPLRSTADICLYIWVCEKKWAVSVGGDVRGVKVCIGAAVSAFLALHFHLSM